MTTHSQVLLSEAPRALRIRGFIAVLSSAAMVGVGVGMAVPLTTFRLEELGYGAGTVGVFVSLYALASILIGPFVPRIALRVGTVTTIMVGLMAGGACIALFGHWEWLPALALLRLMSGFCVTTSWILSESWLNRLATDKGRGRIMAFYGTIWMGGMAAGPAILSLIGTTGPTPFLACGVLMTLGSLPVLFGAGIAPQESTQTLGGSWYAMLMAAPLAMGIGALSGVSEGAYFSLFPLYGIGMGLLREETVLLATCFAVGSVMLQPPLGWLADRMDRQRLLSFAVVGCLATVLLIPVTITSLWIWPVMFLAGGSVAALYVLGLVMLGQRFSSGPIALANAVFIMSYTAGLGVGPVFVGATMDMAGVQGFVIMLATLFLAFFAVRRLSRGR